MSNIALFSRSRESAPKKSFLVVSIINVIKIGNTLAHTLLGIKSVCRYEETCSKYAIRAFEEKGILKGSVISLRRVINCQPFFKI